MSICIECGVAKFVAVLGRGPSSFRTTAEAITRLVSSGTDRYRESGRGGSIDDLPDELASRPRRARGEGNRDDRDF